MIQQRTSFAIFLIVSFALLVAYASPVHADVTGSFSSHVQLFPQTSSSEISLIKFDLQNEINLSVILSGLSTSFHSHFGLAGIEDVIVTIAGVLGSVDIESIMVFGRFDSDDAVPDKEELSFIKKRLTIGISFGGILLRNLSILEDTNFPQTPQYAFGDVVTVSGQTTSGVTVESQIGICADLNNNTIKKHSWVFSVPSGCYDQPNPELVFAFEKLTISGIPLSAGVTGKSVITCKEIVACEMSHTILASGGIIPVTITFGFDNMFTLAFRTATISFPASFGSLNFVINSQGEINSVSFNARPIINPDANPATLEIDASLEPGAGLTSSSIGVRIQRGTLTFSASADFDNGPPINFSGAEFGLDIALLGFMDIDSNIEFTSGSMVQFESLATINF